MDFKSVHFECRISIVKWSRIIRICIEALKGKAATWIENLTREKPEEVVSWELLKPLFLERWNRIRYQILSQSPSIIFII